MERRGFLGALSVGGALVLAGCQTGTADESDSETGPSPAASSQSATAGQSSGASGTPSATGTPVATTGPQPSTATGTPTSTATPGSWDVEAQFRQTEESTEIGVTVDEGAGRLTVTGSVVPSECTADPVLESAEVDPETGRFRVVIGQSDPAVEEPVDCAFLPTFEYELTVVFDDDVPDAVAIRYDSVSNPAGRDVRGDGPAVVTPEK